MTLSRCLAGAFCALAISVFTHTASAQSVQIRGTANGLPLPTTCAVPASNPLTLTLPAAGQQGITASFRCNDATGVRFTCALSRLPSAPQGIVSELSFPPGTSGPSFLDVSCAPNATITNMQSSITRYYQSIADFNAGISSQLSCSLLDDRLVAPSAAFVPSEFRYSYTCVNSSGGGSPQAVSCYVAQVSSPFLRWNSANTALIVPDCINAANPLNSPYIFADELEEIGNRDAQTITFNAPPTQTFSPAGTFALSATASSGLTVTFGTNTPNRCTVSGSTATIVSAGTGANACSITASQNGNASFSAATPVVRAIDINRAPQLISFDPPTTVSATAQTFSWPAPTGGASNNVVVITSLTPDVCALSAAAAHTAVILGSGKCDLVANQAGNANYLPATANRSVAIN